MLFVAHAARARRSANLCLNMVSLLTTEAQREGLQAEEALQ